MEKIAVADILSVSNRKYGGMGGIDVLAKSIEALGLIEPLTVKRGGGKYRVIAGRRRLEAVKKLGWQTVPAVILPEDTPEGTVEEIALAENINRLDMHPLDEAETFKKCFDSGKSVEEIAQYYDRSTSGIYHRIRLNGLIDELKTMFREGNLTITGASVLAGISPEQQQAFYKQCGAAADVDRDEIYAFIRNIQQKRFVSFVDCAQCAACKTRTCYNGNSLFEEYASYDDVCLDSRCYAERVTEKIVRAITKEIQETEAGDAINTVVLSAGAAEYFDEYTDSITVDGVSLAVRTQDGLEEVDDEYAAAYRFRAWHIYICNNGAIKVYDAYFLDEAGRKNAAADEEAARETEDEDSLAEGDEDERDEEDNAEGEEEDGGSRLLHPAFYDFIGIPQESREEVDTILTEKYGFPDMFERAVRNAVLKAAVSANRTNRERDYAKLYYKWLAKQLEAVDWESDAALETYQAYTGESFRGGIYNAMRPLDKLTLLQMTSFLTAIQFKADDIPGLLMPVLFDEANTARYENGWFSAFTGLNRDGFKELCKEAVSAVIRDASTETEETAEAE